MAHMIWATTESRAMKRKLTTIFCADAKHYSAQMAANEDATLARLQHYRALMTEQFEHHDGRQVNTWGDAVIAEFSSVVEAVRCGVAIQDAITAENRELSKTDQMWFRIGINLGDVMHDKGDIYGDGVNVAARLESLADPGGILVSGTVYELSRKQLALGFDFVGDKIVKNIDDPVPSYKVRLDGRNVPNPETVASEGIDGIDAAADQSAFTRTASRAEGAWEWLKVQPQRVRVAAGVIGVLLLLNLLFGGVATPWFIFPSAPFALYIYLHYRRQREGRMPD